MLHRVDGPAILNLEGGESFCVKGNRITREVMEVVGTLGLPGDMTKWTEKDNALFIMALSSDKDQ